MADGDRSPCRGSAEPASSAQLAAWEGLYAEHADRIFAYARRRVPVEDAPDVVAETFVVTWRRIEGAPQDALLRTGARAARRKHRGPAGHQSVREPPNRGRDTDGVSVKKARLQRRILLAGYAFDGPYPSPDDLQGRPGVWAVLVSEEGAAWRPIDVGRSDTALPSVRDLRSGGSGSPRAVGFAASYTESDPARTQIEREVRDRYGLSRHE